MGPARGGGAGVAVDPRAFSGKSSTVDFLSAFLLLSIVFELRNCCLCFVKSFEVKRHQFAQMWMYRVFKLLIHFSF